MATTTAAKLETGNPEFSSWLGSVRTMFDPSEEFELAAEIYSFAAAYEEGRSPKEAYDDFDAWVSA